jgi:hypothetical protein
MNSHSLPRCPECGKPVPAESQHQVCPACLLAQALASGTALDPAAASPSSNATPQPPPPAPEEIAGKFPQFEILSCLGRGGMGVVYKARQKSLNRLVAIKILAPEREHDARFAERFAREAELLAKLSHPHIVTIHDFGEAGGLFYIVMEFVEEGRAAAGAGDRAAGVRGAAIRARPRGGASRHQAGEPAA